MSRAFLDSSGQLACFTGVCYGPQGPAGPTGAPGAPGASIAGKWSFRYSSTNNFSTSHSERQFVERHQVM